MQISNILDDGAQYCLMSRIKWTTKGLDMWEAAASPLYFKLVFASCSWFQYLTLSPSTPFINLSLSLPRQLGNVTDRNASISNANQPTGLYRQFNVYTCIHLLMPPAWEGSIFSQKSSGRTSMSYWWILFHGWWWYFVSRYKLFNEDHTLKIIFRNVKFLFLRGENFLMKITL